MQNVVKRIGSKILQYTSTKAVTKPTPKTETQETLQLKVMAEQTLKRELATTPKLSTTPDDIEKRMSVIRDAIKKEMVASKPIKANMTAIVDNNVCKDVWYKVTGKNVYDSYFLQFHNNKAYIIQSTAVLKYLCISAYTTSGLCNTTEYEHIDFNRFTALIQGKPTLQMVMETYKVASINYNDTKGHPIPI